MTNMFWYVILPLNLHTLDLCLPFLLSSKTTQKKLLQFSPVYICCVFKKGNLRGPMSGTLRRETFWADLRGLPWFARTVTSHRLCLCLHVSMRWLFQSVSDKWQVWKGDGRFAGQTKFKKVISDGHNGVQAACR